MKVFSDDIPTSDQITKNQEEIVEMVRLNVRLTIFNIVLGLLNVVGTSIIIFGFLQS